ncbi:hypothetical protein [Microbacterium maritypicum]
MSAYVDDISENRRDDLMRVIRGAVEQPGRASVGRPIDEAVADAVIAWIDSGGVVVEEPEGRRQFTAAYRATNGNVISLETPNMLREAAERTVAEFAEEDPEGPDYFVASRILPPWVPAEQEGAEG